MDKKIRVLIIDDSALVRQTLSSMLAACPDIEVVGTAPDPFVARSKIKQLEPDVLTLDIEMPKMDGITFLRNLMRLRPMPVVMISSLTEKGADITLEALELGAVDFVSKPKIDLAGTLEDYQQEIASKIRVAAAARIQPLVTGEKSAVGKVAVGGTTVVSDRYSADAVLPKSSTTRKFRTTDKIIAIGSSTGGTEALSQILPQLPPDSPGILIAQHIPPVFSKSFADRMDAACQMKVCEASDGQPVTPGNIYIAPGDQHLMLHRDGARYVCRLSDGAPVNRHRPSVDVLFRSVAQNAGANALGVVLTGMGDDGAAGLLELLDAGGATLVQDEKSSVVWGMPGAAANLGAAQQILGLREIPDALLSVTATL